MIISVIVIRPVFNSVVYSEEERGESKLGEYCPVYSSSLCIPEVTTCKIIANHILLMFYDMGCLTIKLLLK